jgi:hypothetical protein
MHRPNKVKSYACTNNCKNKITCCEKEKKKEKRKEKRKKNKRNYNSKE